ncbi:gluconolactonase [Erwinia sp. OLTSP20]|uniref:SMP-30/gluconolactonase/LRE family protein n=1 Tax=unclassified Erwinia TaxID=2622719 RepID=UPI000C17610E|nr:MULTISPECIES: SMP-30/gluconolactonase/LRE family protein [unclassified Erwinia]PIJ51539.1 gluconolactonase [Erwinia sp. OAMSP11]PIJ75875.1 gluconolactonase [Erwinia sp. OLSSP12]PIJ83449.1 gluconolactonase [Erwinia sp. OLCASP19]PIJ86282.1 gluconolactonase [Erwinia sp. OLMTSP26]PIJ88475.1 gluconolactonase [Erwinia sp. OLMDSP33]
MTYPVRHVLAVQAELGECPLWSVQEQVLYFVDILAPAIHRFNPQTCQHEVFPVAEHIGCLGLRAGGGFVAALRSGVCLMDTQGHITRWLAENPDPSDKSRFNDGRVDPWGRFWCGNLWQPQDRNAAHLCRLDNQYHFRVMAGDIKISNGLAFSPDRRWMYHADTPNGVLYRYPLDNQGEPGAREVLRRFDATGEGLPDGAAVDAEGYYWSALYGAGKVIRIDPANGETVATIALPVRWPTMVAFGGAALKTLYITSSREDRSVQDLTRYPQSGDLFAVDLPFAGLAESLFQDN